MLSSAIHAALIASAVLFVRPRHEAAAADARPLILDPFVNPASPAVVDGPRRHARGPRVPARPDIPMLVVPPVEISPTLPSINTGVQQILAEIGAAADSSGGGSSGRSSSDSSVSGASSVWTSTMVDEPATVTHRVLPRYPRALEDAGVSGRVVLEFVVDTTGRVEAATVVIMSSTHSGFEAPSREAVLAMRFRPGQASGSAVRQMVRQTISFLARH